MAVTEIPGVGGGGIHYHHQNECIKMGSDENHFNASLQLLAKVGQSHKTVYTTITSEEKEEPKRGIKPTPSAY